MNDWLLLLLGIWMNQRHPPTFFRPIDLIFDLAPSISAVPGFEVSSSLLGVCFQFFKSQQFVAACFGTPQKIDKP